MTHPHAPPLEPATRPLHQRTRPPKKNPPNSHTGPVSPSRCVCVNRISGCRRTTRPEAAAEKKKSKKAQQAGHAASANSRRLLGHMQQGLDSQATPQRQAQRQGPPARPLVPRHTKPPSLINPGPPTETPLTHAAVAVAAPFAAAFAPPFAFPSCFAHLSTRNTSRPCSSLHSIAQRTDR